MPIELQVPTPPAPPAPPAMPGAQTTQEQSVQVLQSVVDQLQAQANSLEAQRRALMDQVRHGRAEVRAALAPVLGQVEAQLGQTQARLAVAQAELASRQGQLGGPRIIINPRPVFPSRQFDPDVAAGLMFAFIFAVLMPLSIAISRKIWRSGRPAQTVPRVDDMVNARFDRLEQSVDAIAIEIERISEGQRFMTKVMADRQAVPLPGSNGVAPSSANASQRS